jgi:hypothetical protein
MWSGIFHINDMSHCILVAYKIADLIVWTECTVLDWNKKSTSFWLSSIWIEWSAAKKNWFSIMELKCCLQAQFTASFPAFRERAKKKSETKIAFRGTAYVWMWLIQAKLWFCKMGYWLWVANKWQSIKNQIKSGHCGWAKLHINKNSDWPLYITENIISFMTKWLRIVGMWFEFIIMTII